MADMDNERWLISQIQYYIQSVLELNEADKREFEATRQDTFDSFQFIFLVNIAK